MKRYNRKLKRRYKKKSFRRGKASKKFERKVVRIIHKNDTLFRNYDICQGTSICNIVPTSYQQKIFQFWTANTEFGAGSGAQNQNTRTATFVGSSPSAWVWLDNRNYFRANRIGFNLNVSLVQSIAATQPPFANLVRVTVCRNPKGVTVSDTLASIGVKSNVMSPFDPRYVQIVKSWYFQLGNFAGYKLCTFIKFSKRVKAKVTLSNGTDADALNYFVVFEHIVTEFSSATYPGIDCGLSGYFVQSNFQQ